MAILLRESDAPRSFQSKIAEYVQKPAAPTIRFLKDQIKVEEVPGGGKRIRFALRSGLPIPLIYSVLIRAQGNGLVDELIDYDHIAPFSTDDWVADISGFSPDSVHLEVGIEPFEIRTDRMDVALGRG